MEHSMVRLRPEPKDHVCLHVHLCVCVFKASPEPVWLSSISAGLWGFKPRKDSGVLASPGGDRPKATQKCIIQSVINLKHFKQVHQGKCW